MLAGAVTLGIALWAVTLVLLDHPISIEVLKTLRRFFARFPTLNYIGTWIVRAERRFQPRTGKIPVDELNELTNKDAAAQCYGQESRQPPRQRSLPRR
jgi:hypothetical protein